MARSVNIFFKVRVPIKVYNRLVDLSNRVNIYPEPDENFRALIEHYLQGIDEDITVTKDRPTKER